MFRGANRLEGGEFEAAIGANFRRAVIFIFYVDIAFKKKEI
jgi:hypothetical protein